MKHVMDAGAIEALFAEQFPQAAGRHGITHVGGGEVRLRVAVEERHLRPGGTVSGPTLMTLADTAMYVLVLSLIGPVPLAVTTHLDIDFLRKPPRADLDARATILKLGRRLAVGRIAIHSDEVPSGPVAHASVTYSIPPHR